MAFPWTHIGLYYHFKHIVPLKGHILKRLNKRVRKILYIDVLMSQRDLESMSLTAHFCPMLKDIYIIYITLYNIYCIILYIYYIYYIHTYIHIIIFWGRSQCCEFHEKSLCLLVGSSSSFL